MSRAALGQGMTSSRTRARMVERLQQQGIKDKGVLAAINKVERHLFVDEALRIVRTKIPRCRWGWGKRFLNRSLWRA